MIKTILTLGWSGDFHKLYKLSLKQTVFGRIAFRLYCLKHHCYIGEKSIIADDIYFPHFTGIHIASFSVIGKGCTIHQNVTIGSNRITGTKHFGVPTIGNNVFIGANACIIGGVTIADNVRIGAGCVVVEDIPEGALVVMQKPRIIQRHDKD